MNVRAAATYLPNRNIVAVITGLTALTLVSWAYTIRMATQHHLVSVSMAVRPDHHAWGVSELGLTIIMWMVMMAAMMLPSIGPWTMTLAKMSSQQESTSTVFLKASGFVTGYLVVWSGYSIVAACAQWLLHQNALLSPAMVGSSPAMAGTLLLTAGLFQWTPAKAACLNHCRSPVSYFLTSWRGERFGALQMGFKHGLYCVGCCWALMTLSFVAGVMNLLWMALITVYIFIDHSFQIGPKFGKLTGLVLIGWGVWLLLGGL